MPFIKNEFSIKEDLLNKKYNSNIEYNFKLTKFKKKYKNKMLGNNEYHRFKSKNNIIERNPFITNIH